jgi:histidinol-phosphate aminotransferase
MGVSRRGFFEVFAGGRPSDSDIYQLIAARGSEAFHAEQGGRMAASGPASGAPEIRISSNENPLGPGKAAVEAMLAVFGEVGRYPFNSSTLNEGKLIEAIAAKQQVKTENVILSVGSQELLKTSVRAFTSPYRPLVAAAPTFENPARNARYMKHPVMEPKVDGQMRLDLESMLAVARGAGLIFVNNPNNPTATVHGAKVITDFVERVRRISPDTVILIDEAYHDYVTDPAYASALPLALSTPNVFVTRTFSKAYGMAGMRVGYAIGQPDTLKPMDRFRMPMSLSMFTIAAAIAALGDAAHIDAERARNTAVRDFTMKALVDMGVKPSASETNFLFVNIGRPAKELRDACAKENVIIGRDFPPFENSHARISLGTMDEMTRAVEVFRNALKPLSPSANGSAINKGK